jgi:hypothetical protein
MKKMLLLLVAAFMLVTTNVMATDLDEIQQGSPEYYYYSDPAVRGGYFQTQVPIQGVAINGAVEYGNLAMSADFVAIQALPQKQIMGAVGNSVAIDLYTYRNTNFNFNLDKINFSASSEGYYDNYYGYYGVSGTLYNPYSYYNYYYGYYPYLLSGTVYDGSVTLDWVAIDLSKSTYDSTNLHSVTLPYTFETAAQQAASQSILFESNGVKIQMDQAAFQKGQVKVTGGSIRNGQCE